MSRHRLIASLTFVALIGALASCTPAPDPTPDPTVADFATLRTLIAAPRENPTFVRTAETTDYDADPAELVTYESGGLTVEAVIRRPAAAVSRAPAVVFVHGAYDPDEYDGLTAYDDLADWFVEAGYVVVMPSLRGYGDSDDDPAWETDLDVGATLDVVNAVRATASDSQVDADRIVLAGHSRGGREVLNAALVAPDDIAAVVAMAPAATDPWVEVQHFYAGDPHERVLTAVHGTPESNPDYWRDVSTMTFADRAASPLLVVHGEADEILPIAWSEDIVAAWRGTGEEASLLAIPGADHTFDSKGLDDPLLLVFAGIGDFLAQQLS